MTYTVKIVGKVVYDNIFFYYHKDISSEHMFTTVFLTTNTEMKNIGNMYQNLDIINLILIIIINFLKNNVFPENIKVNSFNTMNHDSYIEFEFPDEETAFYFKLKYC